MFEIIYVTSINERIKNGTTQPFSVKCSDGKIYVLKGINDHCDGKTLFNELISFRLAKLLNLPIPNGKVIDLPLERIRECVEMDLLKFKSGSCFASEYMLGNSRVNPPLLKSISNKSDIPGIILFDQLILNEDRTMNDGNLFFEKRSKRLMIIDHSHIFGGLQTWNPVEILRHIKTPPEIIKSLGGKNYRYLINYVAGNSPFAKIIEILDNVTEEDVYGLFDDIPLEWKINEEEIAAAKQFINHQINCYKEILPQLKIVFTKWKGGC